MKQRRPTVRERLVELLREKGYVLETVRGVKGFWRRQDTLRWDVYCRHPDWGDLPVYLGSWDTMTDCVRYGIRITHEERDLPNHFLVSAAR